jgi:RES domain
VASWRAEPNRLLGKWFAYRQAAPDTAPLFHAAGERQPSQRSGRWHRQGEGYAQYMSLEPLGAWAELVRYEGIRSDSRAEKYIRRLWLIFVDEHNIADLSTFASYEACGLDPRLAVGNHAVSQALASELLDAGYRGVLSPNAALPGATNLTLFGERYEKVLNTQPNQWDNPNPELRLPCNLTAESSPPAELVTQTCFVGMNHDAYRNFLHEKGQQGPKDPP